MKNGPFNAWIGDPEFGVAFGFMSPFKSGHAFYLNSYCGGYDGRIYVVWKRVIPGIYIGQVDEALYHKLKTKSEIIDITPEKTDPYKSENPWDWVRENIFRERASILEDLMKLRDMDKDSEEFKNLSFSIQSRQKACDDLGKDMFNLHV